MSTRDVLINLSSKITILSLRFATKLKIPLTTFSALKSLDILTLYNTIVTTTLCTIIQHVNSPLDDHARSFVCRSFTNIFMLQNLISSSPNNISFPQLYCCHRLNSKRATSLCSSCFNLSIETPISENSSAFVLHIISSNVCTNSFSCPIDKFVDFFSLMRPHAEMAPNTDPFTNSTRFFEIFPSLQHIYQFHGTEINDLTTFANMS